MRARLEGVIGTPCRQGIDFEARDPIPAGQTAPLPRCTAQQIAVAIEVLAGSATIVVRHNWGKPCHLARLPIDLAVWDRTGRRVRLVRSGVPQSGIAGDFSPRFERLIDITYVRLRPAWAILGGGPRWPLQRSRNSLGQGDGLFHRWMKPKREGCGRAAAG